MVLKQRSLRVGGIERLALVPGSTLRASWVEKPPLGHRATLDVSVTN